MEHMSIMKMKIRRKNNAVVLSLVTAQIYLGTEYRERSTRLKCLRLTQVLYLGYDAGWRVIFWPVLFVRLRNKLSDGAHVICLSHERRCHEVHIVRYPVAGDTRT